MFVTGRAGRRADHVRSVPVSVRHEEPRERVNDTGGLGAVLFDMDGLLIDSERLWLEVEEEVVTWLGGAWSREHQERLLGGSLDTAVRYMLDLTGSGVPPAEVGRRMLEGMAERLGASVPMQPGAKELLSEVRAAGMPAALVSSSHRRLIEPVLDAVGRELFAAT